MGGAAGLTTIRRIVGACLLGALAMGFVVLAVWGPVVSRAVGGDRGAPGARAASLPPAPAVVVSLGAPLPGTSVPAGYLGLSLETYGVQSYTGSDARAMDPVFVTLARALSPRGRLVLRIGGDSADQTWRPVPGMTRPPGVSYALTSGWAASVRQLVAATGARLIIDVNLASGSPRLAGAEARWIVRSLGPRRIVALEIGNEPERYVAEHYRQPARNPARGYGFAAYACEFARWRASLPRVGLAGPATGELSWLRHAGVLIAREPRLHEVTFHSYPLNRCVTDPRSSTYPSVSHLLAAGPSRGSAATIAPYVALAHRHGLTFRVDELNAVTCHGKAGVSNTFASALWVINALFSLRRLGVDAVDVHMWPGAPAAQLFTFARAGEGWTAHVRPLYYGLLFFNQAALPGSHLLRIHASTNRALRAWATVGPDGRDRVVLINDSRSTASTVLIRAGRGGQPATLTRLLAPRAASTSGVRLAGQSFGATTASGRLTGARQAATVTAGARGYTVTVPAASAALLTFLPGPAVIGRAGR